ncbi:RNA polymerase sigma factor SigJ [Pseudonocardia eucalypti]|uniref:RNA polymerase sigma factor SigJ n=1 Tax=Pseudonocardia eucalypti TaxID=648755 RepID=A0ABP9Q315_9PSEU|nr:RNA polymerase sigma-70 factor (ECF subfamily) [Pseudonocardia eucalypti]
MDEERRLLSGVAYRMLGSMADAEDAVQETYLRWHRLEAAERAAIRSPRAWKVRVTSRICLDHLGSARARRERYSGVWLPEPVPGTPGPDGLDLGGPLGGAVGGSLGGGLAGSEQADPADRVSMDESVSMALLVLLETITPAERVAFVLHDVFGLPFAEIAETVGRTPEACRALASSARRRIRGGAAPAHRAAAAKGEHARVVEAFLRACAGGDLATLTAVLAPDVVVTSDGGGKGRAALRPITGVDHVARFMLGLADIYAGSRITVADVNGRPGIVMWRDDQVTAVTGVDVEDGRISHMWIVTNPDKLSHWQQGGRDE